jgi:hypothetical protein
MGESALGDLLVAFSISNRARTTSSSLGLVTLSDFDPEAG